MQSCDSELQPAEWVGAFAAVSGDARPFRSGYFHTLFDRFGAIPARRLCPKSCHACKQQGREARLAPCEPGWSYADGACFKYNYYNVPFKLEKGERAMASWFEAESSCQAQGAHLATIETPIQEHLIFQLVSQRPEEVGSLGLWAWVGLWSGPTGCYESGNWTWIGAPQSGVDPRLVMGAQCECRAGRGGSTCEPNVFYTHDIKRGQTMTLSATASRRSKRAWICSKKAMLLAIRQGSCRAAGFLPITDQAMCEGASSVLLGMKRYARVKNDASLPSGCFVEDGVIGGVRVSSHPDSRRVDAGPGARILLCRHANATVEAAATQAPPSNDFQIRKFGSPLRRKASAALSTPVLAVVLVLGLMPAVALIVALARRALRAFKWRSLLALRPSDFLPAASGDKVFDAVVRERLRGVRDTTARAAAVLVACFHFAELLRTVLVEEVICVDSSSLSRLREWLAVLHVANIWVAAAAFTLCGCRAHVGSSTPRLAFVLAAAALELAETALKGEQALLVQSRLYRQLLWRLLFGACASPKLLLASNALISSGMCAMYWARIPDGMVFTVGNTRSGLLASHGCNSLWDGKTATQAARLVAMMSNTFDKFTGDALSGTANIVQETLKRQTSFSDFILSEVVLFAIVTACLLLLHVGLLDAISQSLRLQSSADQLAAVSQILGTLCDATFLLDGAYCIAAPAPTLDVILHLAPSPVGLVGKDFRDFVASADDRARLEEALKEGANSRVLAGEALYLDLRAAGSSKIRMQFLCAQFADNAGARRLICGVSELAERAWPGGGPTGPIFCPKECREHTELEGRGTPVDSSERGSLSDSGSAGEGSSRERPRSSMSCSARKHRRRGQHCPQDVSERDLRLEVEEDCAKVCFASEPFQDFLGTSIGRGVRLTTISPRPEELQDAVRGRAEGDELRIVLNRFREDADGTTQICPCQCMCKVEVMVVAYDSLSGSSCPAPPAPKLRLHVLSIQKLGDGWQPITREARGSPFFAAPSIVPATAVPPAQIGRSTASL